jgi:amino acid adenylation domain-containing protein
MFREFDETLILSDSRFIKQKEYWTEKLSGDIPRTQLMMDYGYKDRQKPQKDVEIIDVDIPGHLYPQLMKLSKESHLSLYMILLAALKLMIYRYSGNKDVAVISPVFIPGISRNTMNDRVFVRNAIHHDMRFIDWLLTLRQSVLEAYENQDYPYEELIKILADKEGETQTGTWLSNVVCLLKNIHYDGVIEDMQDRLIFSFHREENQIKGNILYHPGAYEKSYLEKIPGHFIKILENCTRDVKIKISEICFLSDRERKQLLLEFNDNQVDVSSKQSLHRLIARNAGANPHRVSAVFKNHHLTYGQLNEKARHLAALLRNSGIQKDETAAILLDRSLLMLESILAVWQAGGAYIPIDLQYPAQRVMGILNDSRARVLLTGDEPVESHISGEYHGQVIKLNSKSGEIPVNEFCPGNKNFDPTGNIDGLAYVIYTSGSTGRPKGAMVEHRGMMNHIQAKISDLQLDETGIVVQNANHTFDISVWQFFAPLAVGGKTVIYPNELILEPRRFIWQVKQDGATILEVVPSYLSVVLDALEIKEPLPLPLNYLLVTGEEVKPAQLESWFERYPHIPVVNAYGPTEAADDITHHMMEAAPLARRVPIGKPIRNLNIYIVDDTIQLCPVGIKGEICVSGVGVGRGYLNNPELTNDKFLKVPGKIHPHTSHMSHMSYIYKTGDIGRWLPDGTIEFFGRKDYQVKIRGFRIELGEIESRLLKDPAVKDVVVIDRQDTRGNKTLCAYVVLQPQEFGGTGPDQLKNRLARELPGFMIPVHFVELARIPLTANGKVDRGALPEPRDPDPDAIPYISTKTLEELASTIGTQDEPAAAAQREWQVLQEYSKQTNRDYYPLSHPQKMIYYMEKKYPGTAGENASHLVRYPGQLDGKRLEQAINKVIENNHLLRLRIVEIQKEANFIPAQYIEDYQPQPFEYFDFSQEPAERLQQWVERQSSTPFELIDSPLFYFAILQLNDRESGYYMNLHHIISDQWTCYLLFREINKVYDALAAGETIDETPNFSYQWYISDERDYLNSSLAGEDLEFWIDYLFPLPGAVDLSTRGGDVANISAKVCYLRVPNDLRTHLHEYGKTHHTTLYKLILAALSIYVTQTTGVRDFVVGTLNHNRSTQSQKNTVGPFIRFIPIRIKIDHSMSFKRLVREMGEQINEIVKNRRRYPFDLLARKIREETGIDPAYMYNINLIGHPDFKEEPFKIERTFPGYESVPLTIHINRSNKDIDGILELEYVYQGEAFSERDIKQIHQGLVNILSRSLANPGEKLGEKNPGPTIGANRSGTRKIDSYLLNLEGINEAVVFTGKTDSPGKSSDSQPGEKYTRAYIVSEKRFKALELREALAAKLPGHMIPSYFIQLEKMPLTASGNVNRKILEALEIKRTPDQDDDIPANEIENKLHEIWQKVLGIEKSKISTGANFFQLGGHSLKAIMLASRIHKALDVQLPLTEVFNRPTIKEMAQSINELTKDQYETIKPVEEKEYYEMSSAQERLYTVQQLDENTTRFNISGAIQLQGPVIKSKVEETYKKLIWRHDSFRTSFQLKDDEPVQVIHPSVDFGIEYYDLSDQKEQEPGVEKIIESFFRHFDLIQPPLLRIGMIKLAEEKHILMNEMHHIISDGISFWVMLKEFLELYTGGELPPLRLQYKDFSQWQRGLKESGKIKKQEQYWLNRFKGELPVLNMPWDYPRSPGYTGAGSRIFFKPDREVTAALKQMLVETGTTWFIMLSAAYTILLSKYSRQEDIIIGTPTAGRRHLDLENIMGVFLNMLALRTQPKGEKTFRAYLEEVKTDTIDAFDNQDYQFENLVRNLGLKAETDKHPLFSAVFVLQNLENSGTGVQHRHELSQIKASPYEIKREKVQYELLIEVFPGESELDMTLLYSRERYKESTAEKISKHYIEILKQVSENANIKLEDITCSHDLLSADTEVIKENEISFGF